jgi:hypothetical protein
MRPPPARLAAGALLSLLLCVAAASAADPAAKAVGPLPAAAAPASPALAAPGPTQPAPTTTTTTTNACCAALASTGFTRSVGVPAVLIDTGGPVTIDRTRRPARLCTCGAADLGSTGAGGGPITDWAGPIQLRNRGGTNTQRYNKIRSFAAYLPPGLARANDTGAAAAPVLGLAGDHIIFQGQANDTFMVKEWYGRELARAMGGQQYAGWGTPPGPLGWVPRSAHVELFVVDDGQALGSNASHYRGVYLASEHIQRGRHQVDLPKAEDAGGAPSAIATFLHGEPDPEGTPITGPVTKKEWMVKYPKKDKLTEAGASSLAADLAGFEAGLFGRSIGAPANESAGWRAWMDEAAFTDWFLHTELTKVSKKAYHSASFVHKRAGGPWVMGPIWSQGQGFGTCCGFNFVQQPSGFNGPGLSGGSGISPTGWLFSICTREPDRCTPLNRYDAGNGLALWFDRAFFEDPTWAAGAAARWRALRAGPWSDAAVRRLLDAKRALLTGGGFASNSSSPAARTLARWPAVLGKPWLGDTAAQAAAPFEEVGAWTAARLAWLDRAWEQAANATTRGVAYPASYA